MDFVAEPHHTQEFHPTLYRQQEHNQQTRHYYPPPSPRPLTHSQPQSPVSTSPFSQSSFHQTSATERVLPEVGQTRCYWALLSSDLRFLVLDPVLAYHLHEQASDILNTSLLEFVHPEERNSAKQDLGGVLNERTLHGSVTRVRFCRLSCVRRLLGYTPSEEAPPYPPTFPADRIAIDYNYMAIDIVLNWAAEGVVLCFLHAVVDIAPREDNDESVKTGWSNWCSTYGFDEQQAQSMYRCLSDCILPQLRYHEGRKLDPSLRVLQILRNNADRTLLFSWPPQDISIQSYHAVPHAYDLGRLAQHVEIGTQGGGGEAKTSCTRRYKSYQKMPVATEDEGDVEVESIFVPHGTIIFACHKIDYVHRHPHSFSNGALYQSGTPEEMVVDYLPSSTVSRNNCFVDGGPYNVPYAEEPLEHHSSPTSYVEQWVEGQSQSHLSPLRHRTQWNSTRLHDHTPSPNSSSNGALALVEGGSSSLLCLSGDRDWDQSVAVGVATGVHERSPAHFVPDEAQPLSSSSRNAHRPPSVNATRSATSTPGVDKSRTLHANTPREAYSGSGRSSGNPPVGVSRCASCRATHSPEWRKGPSGKKDLCNACGLRYARNRAKKEGITTRKRKEKEKGSTKHTSSTSLSANSDGQPSSVTPCTQDQLTFDESTRQARGSPSNLSDLSGSGLLHYSAIRQDGSFEGSVRPYSRSESPSYADGFKVSEVRCHDGPHVFSSGPPSNTKGASPTLIQSANQLSPYLGNRELVGSSTRIFSNVERGSYETSSSRMGGFDYNRQVLTSPRDGPEQNSLLSASVQQPSFPSGSRFIGKSSPLRSTTDL